MFGKLALRNVRRSARDYLVYVLTMTFVVSLMFAFNSIIFSKDLQKMYEMAAIMAAMIGIATFFIVLIVAWLINYMVRFMLEKGSVRALYERKSAARCVFLCDRTGPWNVASAGAARCPL